MGFSYFRWLVEVEIYLTFAGELFPSLKNFKTSIKKIFLTFWFGHCTYNLHCVFTVVLCILIYLVIQMNASYNKKNSWLMHSFKNVVDTLHMDTLLCFKAFSRQLKNCFLGFLGCHPSALTYLGSCSRILGIWCCRSYSPSSCQSVS